MPEGGDRGSSVESREKTTWPVCVSLPLRDPSADPGQRSRLLPVGVAGAVEGQCPAAARCVALGRTAFPASQSVAALPWATVLPPRL